MNAEIELNKWELNWIDKYVNFLKNGGSFHKDIKTLLHGKCSNDFYSLVAMHKKAHSFAALIRVGFCFFDAS